MSESAANLLWLGIFAGSLIIFGLLVLADLRDERRHRDRR